jgi:hypothetical protein
MEEQETRRAVELVQKLHVAEGVVACSTEELFVVSYPKEEIGPLFGFTKKDLEGAIELKLLAKAGIKNINGKECQVYMKTVNVANED